MTGLTDLVSWTNALERLCHVSNPAHGTASAPAAARLSGRKEGKAASFPLKSHYFQTIRIQGFIPDIHEPLLPLITLFTYGITIFSRLILFLLCISSLHLSQHQFIIFIFTVSPKVSFRTLADTLFYIP